MSVATQVPNNEHRRGRDLLTLPVYTIDEGKSVGVIDKLFVRRDNLSVPWVRLKTVSLGEHLFIPYVAFQTVGIDIALVATGSAVSKDMPDDDKKALDSGLTGRAVLTQAGVQVGTLAGFEIETVSGNITAFHVRAAAGTFHSFVAAMLDNTVLVPSEVIASLGPDAVILSSTAEALFPGIVTAATPTFIAAETP